MYFLNAPLISGLIYNQLIINIRIFLEIEVWFTQILVYCIRSLPVCKLSTVVFVREKGYRLEQLVHFLTLDAQEI